MVRQKDLIGQIRRAVNSGQVQEPFKPDKFDFLEKSRAFIPKHCEGNPGNYTPYFKRVGRGLYTLIRD